MTYEARSVPEGGVRAEVEALAGDYPPAWHTNLNADGGRPAWFLARAGGRLAGFLTVFDPTGQAVEVQAYVDPAFRRRGVFRGLWRLARTTWDDPGRRWLLVADRHREEGHAAARRLGSLAFTEKTLALAAADRPPFAGLPDGVGLVGVGPEDLDAAVAVHCRANRETEGAYRDFAAQVVADPDRRLLLLKTGDRPVGLVGLHRDGAETGLFSLAVDPDFQGRGWGRHLVLAALDLAAAGTRRFVLDVDSTNARAEALYRSLGFRDEVVTDYFEVPAGDREDA